MRMKVVITFDSGVFFVRFGPLIRLIYSTSRVSYSFMDL